MAILQGTHQLVCNYSMIEIAWKLGVLVATLYHCTCQYRIQVDVSTSICALLAGELLFIGIVFQSNELPTFARVGFSLFVFNMILVLFAVSN